MRTHDTLTLLLIAVATSTNAQEFKPYPRANITEAQWQRYFDEVKSKHGSSAQDTERERLVVFHDPATHTSYAFTTPGHPAHPAWITRQVEKMGGEIGIRQIGYFAGPEPPFAALFKAYSELNARMREDFKRKAQEGSGK